MSVKELFNESLTQFHQLENSTKRQDSEEYQNQLTKAIETWLSTKRVISQLSLFSSNESLEDLNTSELRYLAVDYYMSQLYTQLLKPAKTINLKKAIILNVQYLRSLNDYSLLDKSQSIKFEALKDAPLDIKVLIRETTVSDREEKIGLFKLSRTLATKLEYLEKLESNNEEYEKTDEDVIRGLYLQQLQLFSIKTFENLKLIAQELEVLEMMSAAPKIEEIKDEDSKPKDPTAFTENIESLNKELLSKEGKILQPFTIVKRSDLKKKVFGTGQYLPTMTVEEFLEQELANGGMIQGGGNDGPEESEDEDDYEKNDRETYKQRQWDDFTETHAKGSGNTTNRG